MSVRLPSRLPLLGALLIGAAALFSAVPAAAAVSSGETALKHKADGGKAHTTARHKAKKHHAAAAKAHAKAHPKAAQHHASKSAAKKAAHKAAKA